MSLVHVFAESKQEGQPAEQIADGRANDGSVPGVAAPGCGKDDSVLIIEAIGPRGATGTAPLGLRT